MTNIQSRIALPFFLFSLVFAGILGVSRAFLLPHWMQVEVSGRAFRSAADLQGYEEQLRASIISLEEKRGELLLEEDPEFTLLKNKRGEQPSLMEIQKALRHTATAISKQPDAVHIEHVRFLLGMKRVEVRGDVRFVGPTSMTVLAQFIEGIAMLPFVNALERPAFQRDEDPKIGFHSPFSFSFSL